MSDWIAWDGKRAFKGSKILRVRYRCGMISKQALPAEKWHGTWDRGPDWGWDIIAVRQEG